MTLPDARARVERLRDGQAHIAEKHRRAADDAAKQGDSFWVTRYEPLAQESEANAAALSRVLAELDRLPRLREAPDRIREHLAENDSPASHQARRPAWMRADDLAADVRALLDETQRLRQAMEVAKGILIDDSFSERIEVAYAALTAALEAPTP